MCIFLYMYAYTCYSGSEESPLPGSRAHRGAWGDVFLVYVIYIYIYISIYIYIYRERERDTHSCVYMCMYIYIYREREMWYTYIYIYIYIYMYTYTHICCSVLLPISRAHRAPEGVSCSCFVRPVHLLRVSLLSP